MHCPTSYVGHKGFAQVRIERIAAGIRCIINIIFYLAEKEGPRGSDRHPDSNKPSKIRPSRDIHSMEFCTEEESGCYSPIAEWTEGRLSLVPAWFPLPCRRSVEHPSPSPRGPQAGLPPGPKMPSAEPSEWLEH